MQFVVKKFEHIPSFNLYVRHNLKWVKSLQGYIKHR